MRTRLLKDRPYFFGPSAPKQIRACAVPGHLVRGFPIFWEAAFNPTYSHISGNFTSLPIFCASA